MTGISSLDSHCIPLVGKAEVEAVGLGLLEGLSPRGTHLLPTFGELGMELLRESGVLISDPIQKRLPLGV